MPLSCFSYIFNMQNVALFKIFAIYISISRVARKTTKKYAKKTNNEKNRHTQGTEKTKGRRKKGEMEKASKKHMQLLLSWVSGIALLLVCALTTVNSIRGSTSQTSVQTGALQEETVQETAAKGNGGNAEGNIGQDRVCLRLLAIVVLFLWQEYDLHRFFAARTGFDKPGKQQN